MIKKKIKKKWFMFIWLATLFMLCLGGNSILGVYASLKVDEQITNDFRAGDLANTIDENFTPPTPTNPMTPGKEYPKEVHVTNTGEAPLFVRILVIPEILTVDGILLASKIGNEIQINLGKNWKLGEDGYYYYLGKVSKGEKTSNLFTKVSLSEPLDAAYIGSSMKIHLKSETIIAEGNQYRYAWWLGTVPKTGILQTIDTKLQTLQTN